ncbi:NACHT, LRR and PYD domains-containing protein 12-like isoform X2 [Bufo gargarizans]|uniref:NACHT, LRR and PYD domains-containing protein 12-like isoform X2 n=1 Tax=Bufo gargarizans TaxID=30331 RepID=UPI001CF3D8A0|nr:NACHT, LRR and PYD domains-containing protein 12-like isoform X2 [Bufo gargarizans]
MDPVSERVITEDEITYFISKISQYEDHKVRKMYKYFKEDLAFIVESMDTHSLLSELESRKNAWTQTPCEFQSFSQMKTDLGPSTYSEKLVEAMLRVGKRGVIAFWGSLFSVESARSHPNLITLLEEINHAGDNLIEQIILDKHGPHLSPELKDIQKLHKKHLKQKNQYLVEHRPPGCTLELQSFNINERYVNIVVISSKQRKLQCENELVTAGIKHEEHMYEKRTAVERIVPNKLFRWCHQIGCVPRTVLVRGVPGVGKTTLMKKIVCDWVNKKLYQRFAFIFFFKFRTLNQLNNVSLEMMILQEYPHLQNDIESILQNPQELLFIFDGMDESIHSIDFYSNKQLSNVKEVNSLGVVVVSLVRQSLLRGCYVLLTSRPTKLSSIGTGVFHRVSEIMGFFPKERKIYFETFFKNKDISDKIFQYVKENDTLYTFCYIPSYCWIICTVLSMSFQPRRSDQPASLLPKTVTQLFTIFVAHILSNHSLHKSDAQKLLQSIGWMAEYGVMNRNIIFDERDLLTFKVNASSQLLSSFMIETDQPPNVTFSFLHLTIQEFFAALVHYMDYNQEKLQESLRKAQTCDDSRGEIFLRFLCGLSDVSTGSILKRDLGKLSTETSRIVIEWLLKTIQETWKENEYKDDNRKLLGAFVYLFETRNEALVLNSLGSCQSFDFSYVPLTPLDCSIFPFILESCKETERLNLESCGIQNEGLERLSRALHTIKDVSLRDNRLMDEDVHLICSALNQPNCMIQRLCLSSNSLTHNCCPHLAFAITKNQSLKTLDLSYNSLSGPQFSDLMEVLSSSACRIEELLLSRCNLTHNSCSQLVSPISKSPSLRTLDLSDNRLEGLGFRDLMTAFSSQTCRIETLILSCDGTQIDKSSIQLASTISKNQSLRKLNLRGSKLVGHLFSELMEALSSPSFRIEELILRDVSLTDSACSQLAVVIRNNHFLRKLDLSYNNLVGPHFGDLMEALSSPSCRIEELLLENISLTDESAPLLALLKKNKNLRFLDLNRNYIKDIHSSRIREEMRTSPNLKELRYITY